MIQYPRWMIDDTAAISDGRLFVAHMKEPRFVGEVMPDNEADIEGITFGLSRNCTLCRIEWFDEPNYPDDLLASLDEALAHHEAVRGV